jgi:hypothetical protein
MQIFISLKKKKITYHMSLQLDASKDVAESMDRLFHEYSTLQTLNLENLRIDPIKHKILADRNATSEELHMAELYAKKVLYLKMEKKIKGLNHINNPLIKEEERVIEKIKDLSEALLDKEKFHSKFLLFVKHGEGSDEMGIHPVLMEQVILTYNENKLFLQTKNLI